MRPAPVPLGHAIEQPGEGPPTFLIHVPCVDRPQADPLGRQQHRAPGHEPGHRGLTGQGQDLIGLGAAGQQPPGLGDRARCARA